MTIMYAIANCDTVKKSRKWLEANNIAYEFHDYKKQGADAAFLEKACTQFGWQRVVNQKGMTWRRMDEAEKAGIDSQAQAIVLMSEKTSLIKRPILELDDGTMLLGYDEDEWQAALK